MSVAKSTIFHRYTLINNPRIIFLDDLHRLDPQARRIYEPIREIRDQGTPLYYHHYHG